MKEILYCSTFTKLNLQNMTALSKKSSFHCATMNFICSRSYDGTSCINYTMFNEIRATCASYCRRGGTKVLIMDVIIQ